jgi:hypothetical protein
MRDVPRDGATVGEIVARGNVIMRGKYVLRGKRAAIASQ